MHASFSASSESSIGKDVLLLHSDDITNYRGAAENRRKVKLGKTTITRQCAVAATALFYFAKDRGITGLTPYGTGT